MLTYIAGPSKILWHPRTRRWSRHIDNVASSSDVSSKNEATSEPDNRIHRVVVENPLCSANNSLVQCKSTSELLTMWGRYPHHRYLTPINIFMTLNNTTIKILPLQHIKIHFTQPQWNKGLLSNSISEYTVLFIITIIILLSIRFTWPVVGIMKWKLSFWRYS
jgi:hypothetical protein